MHYTTIPNKVKRKYCENCHYPLKTCLCAWVSPSLIDSSINIVVLQHPKEANHAKNSARLLNLGLRNVNIIQGEHPEDWNNFIELVVSSPEKFSICYPNTQSVPIESLTSSKEKNQYFPMDHTVIFIDASWRKALKIWNLNPWLHKLSSWHFSDPPTNQYRIRQTTQKNSLSTLESVAYVLEFTQNINCSALHILFEKMQQICFLDNKN